MLNLSKSGRQIWPHLTSQTQKCDHYSNKLLDLHQHHPRSLQQTQTPERLLSTEVDISHVRALHVLVKYPTLLIAQ